MQNIFTNPFLNVYHDAEKNIIKAVWYPETENMTEDDFRQCIREGVWAAIAKYKPVGFIGDTQGFLYLITAAAQNWYAENISEFFGTHTRKIAMIVSTDIIAQFSIEQTIDEDERSGFVSRYFDDEFKATEWLLDK